MTSSSTDAPTGRARRLAVTALLLAGIAVTPFSTTLGGSAPEPTSALLTDADTLTTTVRTAADFDVSAPTPTTPEPTATPAPNAPEAAPAATTAARPAARGGGH